MKFLQHNYIRKQVLNLSLFTVVLGLFSCAEKVEKSQGKPNVILILTDDQGFGDLGYYGNPNIKTPVLDSLAGKSVRFDEFLVSPVCAPTRAALMTGRYTLRTGVHDTYRGGAMMATSEITIAELLKEVGYKTGMIGKWHLGDNYPMRPQDQGFDYALNHLSGGIGQSGDWPNTLKRDSSYFNPILWKNGKQYQSTGYCSDVFGDAALDFVENNKGNPFFLYLSFNAPHTPLQVPQEYYDMYKDVDLTEGFENDSRPFPKMHPKAYEYARKVYGMVTNIDDNLGRLFNKLESLELDENTLVIFITDNGPQDPRYIAGMRGRKSSVYQGGVRVPSFWYYPKAFKEPRDIKTPAAHYDILPTLAEFCGAKIPEDLKIDGQSLLPLLNKGKANLESRIINRYWHRSAPVKFKNVSTRNNNYKLIAKARTPKGEDEFELFDIDKDPFELNNIVESYPEKVQEMKMDMNNWVDEMTASPNYLNHPKPMVGTEHENPSVLNLNDAIFTKDAILKKQTVSWEVDLAKAGNYSIAIHFYRTIEADCQLQLQIGMINKVVDFEKPMRDSLVIEDIELPAGETTIFPKVFIKVGETDKYAMPFYVEVKKK